MGPARPGGGPGGSEGHSKTVWGAGVPLLVVLALIASGSPLPAQGAAEAEYTVVFKSTWSATTHPLSFPPGPHFSGLIGATHGDQVSFWEVASLASLGIKNMAELGAKEPLASEIQAAVDAGTAERVISGGGIGLSPGSVEVSFPITAEYPRLSLVSMIAPSPDWFLGISGLSLLVDGQWLEETVIELLPHDAGTDSGVVYTAPNQVTTPPVPIFQIAADPFASGLPLGTFTVTRTNPPVESSSLLLRKNRFKVDVEWRTGDGQVGTGNPVAVTDDTGYFWFFTEGNVETMIKVLNACAFNGRFWVFAGGLTNLEVKITIEDTKSGAIQTYTNAKNTPFQPIQDTSAFATCP